MEQSQEKRWLVTYFAFSKPINDAPNFALKSLYFSQSFAETFAGIFFLAPRAYSISFFQSERLEMNEMLLYCDPASFFTNPSQFPEQLFREFHDYISTRVLILSYDGSLN